MRIKGPGTLRLRKLIVCIRSKCSRLPTVSQAPLIAHLDTVPLLVEVIGARTVVLFLLQQAILLLAPLAASWPTYLSHTAGSHPVHQLPVPRMQTRVLQLAAYPGDKLPC